MQINTTAKKQSHLMERLLSEGKNPLRVFKVFHPAVILPVDIAVCEEQKEYHIIERYMDVLVADSLVPLNRDTLFALLGIDSQGFEIADVFFRDLIANGHFEIMPDGTIKATEFAVKSAQTVGIDGKTAYKYTNKTVSKKVIFDQLSGRLLPSQFYDCIDYFKSVEDITETDATSEYSVWIPRNAACLDSTVEFYAFTRKHRYDGKESIECGLPQGYKKMDIAFDAEAQEIYCPYFLAVYSNDGKYSFEMYDVRKLSPIPDMDKMFSSADYKAAYELITGLVKKTENTSLFSPLCKDWPIKLLGKVASQFGMSCDNLTGNYLWQVQDFQLEELIRMCCDGVGRGIVSRMLNFSSAVLSDYEAGHVLYISMSDEQRQRLSDTLEGYENNENRDENEGKNPDSQTYSLYHEAMTEFVQGKYKGLAERFEKLCSVHTPAGYILSVMYENGLGVKADKAYANELMRAAAAEGYPPAIKHLK